MSRCQEELVAREHENTAKYSSLQSFRLQIRLRSFGHYPLLIRRLCAGYPQCFTQRIPSKSAAFPLLFLTFCTRISSAKRRSIIRNVFAAIPEELAGSAGEKNGEKRAGDGFCGKVGRRWLIVGCWPLAVGRCSTRGAVLLRVRDAQRLWHVEQCASVVILSRVDDERSLDQDMRTPHPAFGHPLPASRGEGLSTHARRVPFSPLGGEKVPRSGG